MGTLPHPIKRQAAVPLLDATGLIPIVRAASSSKDAVAQQGRDQQAPGASWPPDPTKRKARPTAVTASGPSLIRDDEMNDCAPRSTSTQAQHSRILAALARRPHNTFELRKLGAMQVSARVCELRAMGVRIVTVDLITALDEDGLMHHRVAVYAIVRGGKEPG